MSCETHKDLFRLAAACAAFWFRLGGIAPVGGGGVSGGQAVSGTPSQAFPTSWGDREVVLLAQQQSAGLWLGKAAAHCSHHLPLQSRTPLRAPERASEGGRQGGREGWVGGERERATKSY